MILEISRVNSPKKEKKDKKDGSTTKKKNKRQMQERIANILVDIDKSIFEINRQNENKGIIKRLSKKETSTNLKGMSSTKVITAIE